jgi:hypothetical protein
MSFTEDFIVRAEDATYEMAKPVTITVDACDATKAAIRQNAERMVMEAEIARLRAALDAFAPGPLPGVESAIFTAIRRSSPPNSMIQYARMGSDHIPSCSAA